MVKVGRKKTRVEKPEWLEMNKYEQCKIFSAKQWGECLEIRRQILDSMYSIKNENSFDEHINACEKIIAIIRESPCSIIEHSKENELYEEFPRGMSLFNSLFLNRHISKTNFKEMEFKLNDTKLESYNIGSLSVLEAIEIKKDLEKILETEGLQDITDSKTWYKSIKSKNGQGFDSEVIPAVDIILRESFDSKLMEYHSQFSNRWHSPIPSRLHLAVSLTATDEELKMQFNDWLSATRNKFGFSHEKSISNNSLNKLYRNRILAFLDIQIWSTANSLEIQNPQICDWLFPMYQIENKPRKMADIKKIADYAISDSYLRLLLDLDLTHE